MKNGNTATVDPVTLSVLWNGLISVADDMGTTLRHTAYSAAVREGDDFSTGIFDARGRLVAQGNFSPGHLGSMPYVVRHVLDHFAPADFEPGDCVLLNDSFMGSGHYPDCFMTSPLFVDGRLAGFAVNIAHHVDMGGAVPGSQIVEVREAFQEGLRILPVRIARRGELREDVLRLILGNVRLPEIVRGDLLAQRNANAVAAERYAGLVGKHGAELVETAIDAILDRSEARMRELIEALPDGTWSHEDFMDDDARAGEPLRFHVEVTVDGDSIVLDWSGSSDQVEAGINSYINYTRAYSGFAVKVFTDPHLPQNEGVNRPVEIRARSGSFFNPEYPAPSSGRAINQIRMFEVVCGAFAKMRPEPAMASFSHWSNPVMGGVDDRPGRGGPPVRLLRRHLRRLRRALEQGRRGRALPRLQRDQHPGGGARVPGAGAGPALRVHPRLRRGGPVPGRLRGPQGCRAAREPGHRVALRGPASTPPARPRGRAAGDPGRDRAEPRPQRGAARLQGDPRPRAGRRRQLPPERGGGLRAAGGAGRGGHPPRPRGRVPHRGRRPRDLWIDDSRNTP